MKINQRPHRIVAVVKELQNSDDGITSHELAKLLNSSLRNIQSDLKVIKDIYGHEIDEDHYRYKISSFCKVRTNRKIALKLQNRMIVKLALDLLENSHNLSKYKDASLKELDLDELFLPYYIQPEYLETIDIDSPLLKELEEYIKDDYIIDISFRGKGFRVEPYKIANFDGIWYLYAKDLKDKNLQTWPIREIEEIAVVHQKYKKSDEEIEEELNSYLSANFKYNQSFKVIVKVFKEASFLFKAKQYAPDQEIVKIFDDGSLLVKFSATSYKDVDDMIKSHLPDIEIIEPTIFKEKFESEIRKYLKKIEN